MGYPVNWACNFGRANMLSNFNSSMASEAMECLHIVGLCSFHVLPENV